MERVHATVRAEDSGKGLKFVDTLRVLGVVFDRRLNFSHAEHLRTKAEYLSARIVAFKNMVGLVKPSDVRLLYKQVVLPANAYASPIWWPAKPDCRLKSRLLSVQRSVLLALTGAYRTTRTAALQILMHAAPIELELRRLRWTRHPPPQARTVCRLSVPEARAMAWHRGLHIYTDGAHTSLSSGAAYVVFGGGTSIKAVGRFTVHGATSAYCTEVIAFTEELRYLCAASSRQPAYVTRIVCRALASPRCLDPRVENMRALTTDFGEPATSCFSLPGTPGASWQRVSRLSCHTNMPHRAREDSTAIRPLAWHGEDKFLSLCGAGKCPHGLKTVGPYLVDETVDRTSPGITGRAFQDGSLFH
ncbi:hypothetical protein HPB52_018081 [Rhipicephalus sanguineus]|uniref:Uncharacterized protein n=1 Tax=Rhipicephalus sanguineus TaxID=34632 RepID=A0A9D4Q1J7_RHISA|nr:hypothetical protein HPB52_018081 [Rhipicephalus sanguineus]